MTSFIETSARAVVAPVQRSRAVRVVASAARDAADLAELLDMLGLDAQEARPAPSLDASGEEPILPEPMVPNVRGNHRLTISELHALVATASH